MNSKKVGIIGCGHISDTHIQSWKKASHSTVFALFDLNREVAEQKARKYSVPQVFTDIDEIIAACDVLDVCTPPQTHFDIALKIIEAGKHLLIEKPLVTDVDQWEAIKQKLESSGSQLAVLHNLKFALAIQSAKKIIDQGQIGELIRINRYFLTHPDSDRMLVGNKHWSHQLPGGRWYETMPHELYITHYFAGWSELKNVSIHHSEQALPGAPAEEVCFTLQNGRCISNYHYSSNCKMNRRYIEFIGTGGTVVIDILSDMLFVDKVTESKRKRGVGIMFLEALKRVAQAVPDRIEYLNQRRKGVSPHTRIILQFDEFLQGKAPSPTPLEEVDYVVKYCDIVGREIDRQLEDLKTVNI